MTVSDTPHSSASRMMLLTAMSLPFWRTNTSVRPSRVTTPSALPPLSWRPSASVQPSTACELPSSGSPSGIAVSGPAIGMPSLSNNP